MTAKTVSGAGHQRVKLGECLPIQTPFSLHIFPSHRCNLRCGYCLHSLPPDIIKEKNFEKKIMEFDLFKKCVDGAARFPTPFKVLILAGWGEPLTHPQIAEMVEYAKKKNIAERIEIVSNGVLLTPSLSTKLIEAGLDRIRISIQGINSAMYRNIANVDIDFQNLVDKIAYFHANKINTKIYVKTVDSAVPNQADKDKFHQIFEPITDEIAIENIIPAIRDIDHSKFGNRFEKRHCGGDASLVTTCPFPFYMSVIHPDGSYAPCCSPERPLFLGNIHETSLLEIWQGEEIKKFRIAHLEGKRGGSSICRNCSRPQYDIQQGDNLDPYSKKLLPLYEAPKTN